MAESIEKQFWVILSEVDQRSTTKLNVKDNATTEKEAEQQFQSLKFIIKQIDGNLRKRDDLTEEQVDAFWNPVKAFLCKGHASSLLNKLTTIQAFHNDLDLNRVFQPGQLTMQGG